MTSPATVRTLAIAVVVVAASASAACTGLGSDTAELPQAVPKWDTTLGSDQFSSMKATDENLFAVDDISHDFIVLDADTGHERWSLTGEEAEGNFWAADDQVITYNEHADIPLTVYDTESGDEEFTYPEKPDDEVEIAAATTTTDTVILAERKYELDKETSEMEFTVEVIGLAPDTGDELWRSEKFTKSDPDSDPLKVKLAAPAPEESFNSPSMHTSEDLRQTSKAPVVYVSLGTETGTMTETVALDASDGKQRWQLAEPIHALDESTLTTLADGRILSIDHSEENGCEDIAMVLADPKTDKTGTATTDELKQYDSSWECHEVFELPRQDTTVLGQDSDHHPQLVDVATGKTGWTAEEAGNVLLYRDGVAIYETGGEQYDRVTKAVDTKTGKLLWQGTEYLSSDNPKEPKAVDDDFLVTSGAGTVAAYGTRDGRGAWRTDGNLMAANHDYYFVDEDGKLLAVPHDGGQ